MSQRKLSQPGSCYSRKRVIVRVVSLERSILEDERSLLVEKWSTNGNAEGIWDENGTKNRARRGRTESAEEERERGGGKRARRRKESAEEEREREGSESRARGRGAGGRSCSFGWGPAVSFAPAGAKWNGLWYTGGRNNPRRRT